MSQESGGDEPVGYCRPPTHSQFKKKVSGNPDGRPRGSKNRQDILRRIAAESHEVREGGRIKRMRTIEIILTVLRTAMANGDQAAQKLVDKLLGELPDDGPMVPKGVAIFPEKLTMEEWAEKYTDGFGGPGDAADIGSEL